VNQVSLILAVVGVLASAAARIFLKDRPPRHYWLIGLATLFPAWLVAFLAVISPASQSPVDVPLPPRALFSSSVGLMGIIATDYLLRQSEQTGRVFTPVVCWLIGLGALIPAWLIAAVNL
jgi:uncharacterized membrane protein (GlpM family)